MHEVGIMEETLEQARRLMLEHGGSQLFGIQMTVGSLSGVVPEALETAFLALRDISYFQAEQAQLEISRIEAICRCDVCALDFAFSDNGYICPHCGEAALSILRGRELELTRVEWR